MATIIKSEALAHGSGMALRHVAFDLTDMALEADGYLSAVRREAAAIVDQAKRDAAAIRQEAEAAGREAAEAAIERILDEKVARQMTTLTPALRDAVEQIRETKQEWLRHWERAALELAAAIAGRLLRAELARQPEISLEWVREALEYVTGSGEIVIHLNAADHAAIERQVERLAGAMHPTASVRLVADDVMRPGGCRVTTEFGSVDMQIEAQLERIKQELG